MNRYAMVENGVVTNVIIWDGNAEAWQPPAGSAVNLLTDDSPVGPGWTFDGANYSAPKETTA